MDHREGGCDHGGKSHRRRGCQVARRRGSGVHARGGIAHGVSLSDSEGAAAVDGFWVDGAVEGAGRVAGNGGALPAEGGGFDAYRVDACETVEDMLALCQNLVQG